MKEERIATGGAVMAAFAASLCCIGPLLFVLFGLGTFGVAALVGTARPYLLGVAVMALALGFYLVYFRCGESCAPGDTCSVRPVSRTSRISLWIATVSVIAFALSPYYVKALTRRLMTANVTSTPSNIQPHMKRATFKVSGMTCAGCEITIKTALEKTPGVRSAEVSYDRGEAIVEYDPTVVIPERLREAINETGYTGEILR